MFFNVNCLIAATCLLYLRCRAYQCYEEYCYFKGPAKLNFLSAISYCEENGAILTSIHSQEENDFIETNFCRETFCWIGFRDDAVENDFVWEDESPVSYTNWYTGEPNNYQNAEDATVLAYYWNGAWNDVNMNGQYWPVCKTPKTAHPTLLTTGIPTEIPSPSPTSSCDAVLCYGNPAFGANCSGPSDEINFPIMLTKSTKSYEEESKIHMGHIEIYPAFSIDLTNSVKVRFDTKITNISDGSNHGALLALSVKYDGCYSQLFTLTQPMWAATSCADDDWHTWEVKIYFDAIEVSCDDTLVWNHARTDMQVSWEVGDEPPFLAIGAYYSPIHKIWQSRCDMVVQNVEILTCDTGYPTSSPSKSPTVLPTGAPTHFPTNTPTKLPTVLPTSHPTMYPTEIPTHLPTRFPTKTPSDVPSFSCDVLTARCYGEDAFGAECNGPTTNLVFPITLTKATTTSQAEDEGECGSHIEVYPTSSIDLTASTKIRFDAKIFDIIGGEHYGTVFALFVKYEGSDNAFNFNQMELASTACKDIKWHSWEIVVYIDEVRVFCDEMLVHVHTRTDSQKLWEVNDDSPFFVLGAHYSNDFNKYYSRCDMILQKLRIFSCEAEVDA